MSEVRYVRACPTKDHFCAQPNSPSRSFLGRLRVSSMSNTRGSSRQSTSQLQQQQPQHATPQHALTHRLESTPQYRVDTDASLQLSSKSAPPDSHVVVSPPAPIQSPEGMHASILDVSAGTRTMIGMLEQSSGRRIDDQRSGQLEVRGVCCFWCCMYVCCIARCHHEFIKFISRTSRSFATTICIR